MDINVIIGGIVLLGGIGVVCLAYSKLKNFYLIKSTPTLPINRVYKGLAEVKGKAIEGDRQLISPISETPCVYYEVKVEELQREYNRRGRSHKSWKTLKQLESSEPIYLEDGTGRARVLIQGAEMVFNKDIKAESKLWSKNFPPVVENYLQSIGLSGRGNIRLFEIFVKPGDRLYVLGSADRKGDQVNFEKQGSLPMVISDFPEEKLAGHFMGNGMALTLGALVLLGLGLFLIVSKPK